jgi:hypothetical protein
MEVNMATLIYQSGEYFKCKVEENKLFITHQQEQTTPEVGDCIALGRHYAKAYEGVVLDTSGRIVELRAPGFETPGL